MSLTFLDLQNEVKERATRNQGGTTFDTATKNAINTSLFRLSRECPWKQLRRKTHFLTDAPYTTGSGSVSVTEDNGTVTVTGATFITNNIKVGRRVDLGGSSSKYSIGSITGETTFTLADSKTYDGTTSTTQTYKIYGTEEYNLPIQAGRIALVWHEDYGYPYPLSYVTDTDFIEAGIDIDTDGTPTHYRQWGEDCVIEQPYAASVLRVTSSSASDTSKSITVFGTVSGYPDYETITTNASDGTTAVSGTKSFTSIERVVKDSSTVGRITVDSNSANVTVAVLPVGDATGSIMYKKIQLHPLPDSSFPIYVQYYKDPWRLVNDGEIHELGPDFDEALILLATSKIKYQQSQKEGDRFFTMYKDELASLRRVNMDRILHFKPRLRKPHESRGRQVSINRNLTYGQIGGWFGPSSR